jgi:site-specific DNA recombinase
MLYNSQEYPHKYEPIISRELFARVQKTKTGYMKKHSKFAGLPYVYGGLISCAICVRMITPEKKKGKYIYYHCTEYDGKHKADWVREEELTTQFAQLYRHLQVPPDIIGQIIESLRESHQDKTQFHMTMLEAYQNEYQKYETRIEKMYEDKLDGLIDENLYNKKREEYRQKQQELRSKISRLDIVDEDYYLTSEYLLQLVNRAYSWFLSSELEEKRQLIKLTLQNLKLRGKKLDFEFVKPFDQVFACSSRQSWLGDEDSNLAIRSQSPLSYR